ncbi:hypothetical protein HU200_021114 [Digitaria exilis]|uniref:Beta-glucosidase n=1 Tax=Digitaria exilis TaxID=1010633 RepID=A0A835EZT9_9POAL|nr:hypothetical protein HU200_021114 [Digitaria exilis]
MTRLRLPRAALLLVAATAAAAAASSGELGGVLSRDDFPEGFVFGAGTSAYQWEGAAAEDGRSPSVWDTFAHADGRGEVNPKGLEYYNNLINELLDHGIEPHVTLFQYDLPQVLEDEYNGWLSPQIIDDFTAYSDVCFREFGDRVTNWTTLNEPNAFALLGYDVGFAPPGRCSEPFGNCSNGDSEKQHGIIGMNIFIYDFVPLTNSMEDTTATERAKAFYAGWFLDPLYHGEYPDIMKKIVGSKLPKFSIKQSKQLINSVDFLGVNYYSIMYVKDDPQSAPSNERDFLADLSAKTMYMSNSTTRVLEYLKQSYGNPPIYIHENGYAMKQDVVFDDGPRVEFLSEHLRSLADSVRNGSNTKGYFVWSLMDLYELLGGGGLGTTYGLYYVDFADKDLKRYPRRSALWYADFLKGRSGVIPARASGSSLAVSSV